MIHLLLMKMKDVVMSDEAYQREIEMYGDLLETLRGEVSASGKFKLTFHTKDTFCRKKFLSLLSDPHKQHF